MSRGSDRRKYWKEFEAAGVDYVRRMVEHSNYDPEKHKAAQDWIYRYDTKFQRRADFKSTMALVVSIGVALVSGYQYLHSQADAKINAAIDISEKIIADENFSLGNETAMQIYSSGKPINLSAADRIAFSHMAESLHFLAALLEQGRIDQRYVSDVLLCQAWLYPQASRIQSGASSGEDQDTPVQRLAKSLESKCRPRYPR